MAESRTYLGNGSTVTIADPENITRDECIALACCGYVVWNDWRKEFSNDFSVWNMHVNSANFSGHTFEKNKADFANFEFGVDANFDAAIFLGEANFRGACFDDGLSFKKAEFFETAIFAAAQLAYSADFSNTTFRGDASFIGTQFGEFAKFIDCKFEKNANFLARDWDFVSKFGAKRGRESVVQWAKDRGLSPYGVGHMSFRGAKFSASVMFTGRHFNSLADFGVNEKGDCVEFASPPIFHDCKLAQDFRFDGAKFPKASGNLLAARAYRTLKLAFAQQQAVREEQRFFKLEMQEEAIGEKSWRRWLYRAYQMTSDFGFSISRPLGLFVLATLVATLIYANQAGLTFDFSGSHTAALVQFSIASAIPGLEKLAEPAAIRLFGDLAKGVTNYNVWVVLTLLAHKAVSLLSLFLVGLALRNLFKMK